MYHNCTCDGLNRELKILVIVYTNKLSLGCSKEHCYGNISYQLTYTYSGNVHTVYCRGHGNASKHRILLYTTLYTLVHCTQKCASHGR